MPDQKNLMMAIVLSVVIVVAFQMFYEMPRREAELALQQQQAEQAGPEPGSRTAGQVTGQGTTPLAPGGAAGTVATPAASADEAATESRAEAVKSAPRVAIDSARLSGSISLKGGRIDDLILKDYRVTIEPGSPNISLLSPVGAPHPYYAEFGWVAPQGTTIKLPDKDTVWRADSSVLSEQEPLTLSWDNGQGLVFTRTIAVDRDYMFTITQTVRNTGTRAVTLYPFGLVSRHGKPKTLGYYILHEGMLGVFDEKLEEVDYDDVEEAGRLSRESSAGWIGITDKYWMVALLPDQHQHFGANFWHFDRDGDKYQVDFVRDEVTIQPGAVATVDDRLFAGAKEVAVIDGYDENLGIKLFDRAIDWGWFFFLTKPMFQAVSFFHRILGNFGLAIILLTVCVKILFLPLAHKSYVSMSRMKTLQPQMLKLREQYGEDRQALNQEMMKLYKREKVNPVSGCLPILLQVPVFFALYKTLFVTIEMRQAPFYGWIKDLSAPDPTSVFNLFGLIPFDPPQFLMIGAFPLAMGISMWLQQKLNPQPPDPVQAKIMMFMPIMFIFLLARFPAGLVIYWTCNNMLSIAQQWFILKRVTAAKPAKT